jgi:hypothetical protein
LLRHRDINFAFYFIRVMKKERKYFELYPVHPVKHIEVGREKTIILEPTPVMIKTLKKCFELELGQPATPYGPADLGRGFSGLFNRGLLDVKTLHAKGKNTTWFITKEGLRVLISKLKDMCHVVVAKTEKGEVVCITKKSSYEDCEIAVENLEELNIVYETTLKEIRSRNKAETPKKMGLILTSAQYKKDLRSLHKKEVSELHKVVKPKYYKSDLYIF